MREAEEANIAAAVTAVHRPGPPSTARPGFASVKLSEPIGLSFAAGLGTAIIRHLLALSVGHKKIILYANLGTDPFYLRLGFLRMKTAMAIWRDRARAIEAGPLKPEP